MKSEFLKGAALVASTLAVTAGGVAATSAPAEAVQMRRVVVKVWSNVGHANVEACMGTFSCPGGTRAMPFKKVKMVPQSRLYLVDVWADTFNRDGFNAEVNCLIKVDGEVKRQDGNGWTAFCAL
jgi:hypothetical protein